MENNGIYYTTAELKTIFGWSLVTIWRKRKEGVLPPPSLQGKPNKWLKTEIQKVIEKEQQAPYN